MILINKIIIENLDDLRLFMQIITAIISLIYYKELKETFWKWFVFYLITLVFFEVVFKFNNEFICINKDNYFDFFIIPLQFFFFYWLYNIKSKITFYVFSVLYLISLLIDSLIFETSNKLFFSFSYCIGNILLFILIIREFLRFFKSEEIIFFKSSKMFYINLGNFLFYVGTLPFIVFYEHLKLFHFNFFIFCLYFFKTSICIMYLFYTASFIWGKPKTY